MAAPQAAVSEWSNQHQTLHKPWLRQPKPGKQACRYTSLYSHRLAWDASSGSGVPDPWAVSTTLVLPFSRPWSSKVKGAARGAGWRH